ncbi:MAG: HAD family hydrolase [Ruthenibacterium sp.]
MKHCKAIFFDWDGTAVVSRNEDATKVLEAMETLLCRGIPLIIISGTTYKNICGGKLETLLSKAALQNLYLGLARGNCDYAFDENGKLYYLHDATPSIPSLLALHRTATELHCHLLARYNLHTDIFFSRPNYCKIDLMVDHDRSETLFLQEGETDRVAAMLKEHGIAGGLPDLTKMGVEFGKENGLILCATTDAKYLELGYTTKSDNVDRFLTYFSERDISPEDCFYWGDEFGEIAPGILGSDAQMITERSAVGKFFSVSKLSLPLPKPVQNIGGGPEQFIAFLEHCARDGADV